MIPKRRLRARGERGPPPFRRRGASTPVEALGLPEPRQDLLALDEALTRLAEKQPLKAELVKLRFFAGLTMPEAARALGVSLATAERYRCHDSTELAPKTGAPATSARGEGADSRSGRKTWEMISPR